MTTPQDPLREALRAAQWFTDYCAGGMTHAQWVTDRAKAAKLMVDAALGGPSSHLTAEDVRRIVREEIARKS